jgi:hypothetical protein
MWLESPLVLPLVPLGTACLILVMQLLTPQVLLEALRQPSRRQLVLP